MTTLIRAAALAVILAASAALPAGAQGPAGAEREAIEKVIHDYIVNNPDVILKAIDKLEERKKDIEADKRRAAIQKHADAVFGDKDDPTGGKADGKPVIVEFFDYRCGYCKNWNEVRRELIKPETGIRFVYKEFPILSKESAVAAKAALAIKRQGKYEAFHDLVMEHTGSMTDDAILAMAGRVGADVDRLKKDMADPAIAAQLGRVRALAEALDINGTPALIIGDEFIPGAMPLDDIRQVIARQRRQ